MKQIIGIDIAKESFEVCMLGSFSGIYRQSYENNSSGHQGLLSQLRAGDLCVMEASGPYYLRLAICLHEAGMSVSVVNPLVIRRYSQMQLKRSKTDRMDAQIIAQYGQQFDAQLPIWEPPNSVFIRMRQLISLLELQQKQLTMLTNHFEALQQAPVIDRYVKEGLEQQIKQTKQLIQDLDKQLVSLSQNHFQQTNQRLQSIPGIGPKTAALLIATTHDFARFDSAKQLVAFVGLCPRIFQSGSSVKGKERIVKMGQPTLRKLLYMAAFSAMKYNQPCVELTNRLKQKGKHYRTIRVAVAHKLLRQAFGVVHTQTLFDSNFVKST